MLNILILLAGIAIGVGVTVLGLYIGWRASFIIRAHHNGTDETGDVFLSRTAKEFDLIDDPNTDDEVEGG